MSENNILKLVQKFEETLENTEKLTDIMMGLEGALTSLDNSINEVYELTKADEITNKSLELLTALGNIKKVQGEINKEYEELINIKFYKDDLKSEIQNVKNSIVTMENNITEKFNNSFSEIKEDIKNYQNNIESNQKELKEEILQSIRDLLDKNNI